MQKSKEQSAGSDEGLPSEFYDDVYILDHTLISIFHLDCNEEDGPFWIFMWCLISAGLGCFILFFSQAFYHICGLVLVVSLICMSAL